MRGVGLERIRSGEMPGVRSTEIRYGCGNTKVSSLTAAEQAAEFTFQDGARFFYNGGRSSG
jgi:hypothetical protein